MIDRTLPGIFDLSLRNLRTFVRGERSLKAAWGFWFFGGIAFRLIFFLPTFFLIWVLGDGSGAAWFLEHEPYIMFPFTIVAVMVVWKCSTNAKRRFWYFGARAIAGILLLLHAVSLVIPHSESSESAPQQDFTQTPGTVRLLAGLL